MSNFEDLLERWNKEGGLSDEFTQIEKAILYWHAREGDESYAREAFAEMKDFESESNWANAYQKKAEKLEADIDEAVRCIENAIKFVYHYYGDNKEALADMETSTWRIFVKDKKRT